MSVLLYDSVACLPFCAAAGIASTCGRLSFSPLMSASVSSITQRVQPSTIILFVPLSAKTYPGVEFASTATKTIDDLLSYIKVFCLTYFSCSRCVLSSLLGVFLSSTRLLLKKAWKGLLLFSDRHAQQFSGLFSTPFSQIGVYRQNAHSSLFHAPPLVAYLSELFELL